MLILSASFLAVQLWSEDVFRGAAEALEAPMLPPALPVGKKTGSKAALGKKIEQAKAAVAVEVVSAPEIQEPAKEEPVETVEPVAAEPVKAPAMVEAPAMPADAATTAPVKAKEVVVEAKASSKKPAKAAVEVKPAKVETEVSAVTVKDAGKKNLEQAKPVTGNVEVISKPSIVTIDPRPASPVVGKKSVTTSGKKIRGSRKAAREIDENEVPPEWNWFSTPLKLEFSGGSVEIVPVSKPRDIQLVSVVARLPADLSVDVSEPYSDSSDETSESQKMADPAIDKPFVSALARMVKLRYVRMAAIDADPELKKAAAAAHRSRGLEELRLAVAGLRSRLEAGASDAVVVSPVAAVSASEVSVETDSYVAAPDLKPASDDADAGSASPSTIEATEEPVVAAGIDEKADYKFVPYYSGSGSAMSSRINTLLQRGIGYSRR